MTALIDLDELERLAKAAEPGPWRVDETARVLACDDRQTIITIPAGSYSNPSVMADAAFIAAANPQTVLALVEEVRRLSGATALAASNLINDDAFMAKLVDEHEKKYGDAKNVANAAIVHDLAAATVDGPASNNCVLCLEFYDPYLPDAERHSHHRPDCPYRRAREATK